jgi:hypothetical protein
MGFENHQRINMLTRFASVFQVSEKHLDQLVRFFHDEID